MSSKIQAYCVVTLMPGWLASQGPQPATLLLVSLGLFCPYLSLSSPCYVGLEEDVEGQGAMMCSAERNQEPGSAALAGLLSSQLWSVRLPSISCSMATQLTF